MHVTEPALIRLILANYSQFQKLDVGNSLTELLLSGLADVEADQWTKHRKIMNHAFHVEKLKVHLLYGLPEQKCQYVTKINKPLIPLMLLFVAYGTGLLH